MNNSRRLFLDHVERNPLTKFSFHTQVQVDILLRFGNEINEITDIYEESRVIEDFNRCYGKFWLWVLGAYEVIRTMDQNKECFSDDLKIKIRYLKIYLATLRMPFAKLELAGKRDSIITSELSVIGFKKGMCFEIDGKSYSSGNVIEKFSEFIQSIRPDQVLVEGPRFLSADPDA